VTDRERGTPPPVASDSWTGRLPETALQPRPDAAHRGGVVIALMLMGAILALWVSWWFLLSLHAPTVADPGTGQTVPLQLREQGGATLYVRPWEAAVSLGLAIAAFVLPAVRLAWEAMRRRR
jgi:hypothetical protein